MRMRSEIIRLELRLESGLGLVLRVRFSVKGLGLVLRMTVKG